MRKSMRWVAMAAFAAVVGTGFAALFATPASAKGSCWQVDCNTCCRTPGGGTVCTQRACV